MSPPAPPWLDSARVLGLAVAAAAVYGVLHDQVTARVCVEYFTVAHPPVFGTEDPTLLGLGWGVLATWWVGVLMGIPLAGVTQWGTRPRLPVGSLVRPLAVLLGVMGASALVAGVLGYATAARGGVQLSAWLEHRIPAERHARFVADAWAHGASYAVGFLGGLALIYYARRQRQWLAVERHAADPGDRRPPPPVRPWKQEAALWGARLLGLLQLGLLGYAALLALALGHALPAGRARGNAVSGWFAAGALGIELTLWRLQGYSGVAVALSAAALVVLSLVRLWD